MTADGKSRARVSPAHRERSKQDGVDGRKVEARFNPTPTQMKRIREQLEDGVVSSTKMALLWKTSPQVLRERFGEEWWETHITKRKSNWTMSEAVATNTYAPGHEWVYGGRRDPGKARSSETPDPRPDDKEGDRS